MLDAGHDRGDHVADGRDVIRTLPAGQPKVTRRVGLRHEAMQLVLVDGLSAGDVDVRHPKRGREGLSRSFLACDLVAEAGEVCDDGIAGSVDDDGAADPPQAGCRGDHEFGDPLTVDQRVLHGRMQQYVHPSRGDEVFPHHLQVIGEIGHACPSAVGVGTFQHLAVGLEMGDDIGTYSRHDALRL